MVTGDSLNLDVLELIFAYISGNDLVAVSSVSKAFLAGVIPHLYATVYFTAKHAERYYRGITSPFLTLKNRPDLAVHVRHIDINCPFYFGVHSSFLLETVDAVQVCNNLKSFVCTQEILPALIGLLAEKERLEDVHIHAEFTIAQGEMLQNIKTLRSLTLDYPTRNVVELLPRWAQSLQHTLVHLTIFMSPEVNGALLEALLPMLPRLRGLHVIGCPKTSHLEVIKAAEAHTPLLKELSFTIFERALPTTTLCAATLPDLLHLVIDVHPWYITALEISSLFTSLISLSTFVLKFPNDGFTIWNSVFDALFPPDTATVPLKRLALMGPAVSMDMVRKICSRHKELERLELPLPIKEMQPFIRTVSGLKGLHTLIDVRAYTSHDPYARMTRANVKFMMRRSENLKKIVSDGRMWTGSRDCYGTTLTFQFCKANTTTRHWFSPLVTDSSPV